MEELAKQPILSYAKFDEPLTEEQTEIYLNVLPEWTIVYREGNPRLEKSFSFDDFMGAVNFANQVAALAEEADHHPSILISSRKCAVRWWTFVYKRLHENDFIMAARTEKQFQDRS
jgi:4a-hydroxytetrahydrobiopterin dehydratase